MAQPNLYNAIKALKTCEPHEVFSGKSGNKWIINLADKLSGSNSFCYSSEIVEETIKEALLEGGLTDKDIKVLLIFWDPSSQDLATFPTLEEYFKRQKAIQENAIEEKQYDALISGPFDSIGPVTLFEARFARTH